MKNVFSKICAAWFPALVVGFFTIQAFASGHYGKTSSWPSGILSSASDTVIYTNDDIYTKFRSEYDSKAAADSAAADSLSDSTEVFIPARDTMKVPDYLRLIDPFRYKYYVAIKDSLTHIIVRDSLREAGDTVDWPKLDSLYRIDSAETAQRRFNAWYASLDKAARKKYDFEQKMKVQQAHIDSLLDAKDSLLAIRDSIRESTPRILETFAVADSLQYKRILKWNSGRNFNDVLLQPVDTSYNRYFYDYPFAYNDVGVTYLGTAGSAVQTYDFSKRISSEGVSFYTPYECYTYSPYSIPLYNTKTPYTELAYWGTLFANAERAENDLHIMTTQNFYPEWNLTLEYDRFGSNGMLENENVDNRTFSASTNYMGKRYSMNAGYIYNKMSKGENGGIVDNTEIRDTTIGSREVAVRLADASTLIKKNTIFLDQTYRIPFNFITKITERKALRKDQAYRDSVNATGDSTAIAAMEELLSEKAAKREELAAMDTVNTNITTAYIGHTSEYSVYRKIYKDNIAMDDSIGRSVYNNNFYLNPVSTSDSLRVMKFENKVFIKLQPWKADAIVSSLNVGIGDRLLNYYMFTPESYLKKRGGNEVWNSAYIYGGAKGQFKNYFTWNAEGYYTFLGEEINDTGIKADARFNIYPFRRYRKSPMSFNAHFDTSVDEPDYYQQNYYSNHYIWDNDFSKISRTYIEGSMDVPHWKFNLTAGWTLTKNHIYYDNNAVIRQSGSPVSVFKLALNKNFKLWGLHFDNRVLFQTTSNKDIIPLPMVAIDARWYWQFNVVRNVMQMQIGADVTYNTQWYAPGYSPALGTFFNQQTEKYGNCPYIDAFVNIQWKRACIFVKLVNAGMGWPMDSADYFSAHGYIRPQRALKFGIFWPFYLQPHRNKVVDGVGSDTQSSSSSERRSSGSMNNGMNTGIGFGNNNMGM